MVDEETAKRDHNNYYHKYHMVEIDFGQERNDEDKSFEIILPSKDGHKIAVKIDEKLTKDTLVGKHSEDNAEIFLKTLQKTRNKHFQKVQD